MATQLPTVIADHALETRAMLKVASGGSAASEASDVAVNPTGVPSGVREVTAATPAACRRNACLKASTSVARDSFTLAKVRRSAGYSRMAATTASIIVER